MRESVFATALWLKDTGNVNSEVSLNVVAIVDGKGNGLKIVACANRPEFLGKIIRQEHEAKRLMANGIFQSVWNQLERKGWK